MSRTHKDHKDYWKTQPDHAHFYRHNIPSWYKHIYQKLRRAKERHALKSGQEIPRFKKGNSLYW